MNKILWCSRLTAITGPPPPEAIAHMVPQMERMARMQIADAYPTQQIVSMTPRPVEQHDDGTWQELWFHYDVVLE